MAAAFTEQHLLPVTKTVGQLVLTIEKELAGSLLALNYSDSGVTHIYNPVDYARVPHEIFVTKFCKETISTLLIGMNPGPWGMVQTGVRICLYFLLIFAISTSLLSAIIIAMSQ